MPGAGRGAGTGLQGVGADAELLGAGRGAPAKPPGLLDSFRAVAGRGGRGDLLKAPGGHPPQRQIGEGGGVEEEAPKVGGGRQSVTVASHQTVAGLGRVVDQLVEDQPKV